MLFNEVPKLGMEAATEAIHEWGFQTSQITHLIFCTTSNLHVPGPDYHLTKLLGLSASVKRLMMYQQGCSGGGMALRVAKDIAENNKGSRVLVVCCEMTASLFRGPNENHIGSLVGQALLGDGAAAVIVGVGIQQNELSTSNKSINDFGETSGIKLPNEMVNENIKSEHDIYVVRSTGLRPTSTGKREFLIYHNKSYNCDFKVNTTLYCYS